MYNSLCYHIDNIFVYNFSQGLFVKVTGDSNKWTTYSSPFGKYLWLAIFLTLMLSAGIYFIINRFSMSSKEDVFWISMLPIYAISNQGNPVEPSGNAKRMTFLGIFLLGLFMVQSYSACLISFLTVNVLTLPFNSKHSFLSMSNYRITTVSGSSNEDLFKVSLFHSTMWQLLLLYF